MGGSGPGLALADLLGWVEMEGGGGCLASNTVLHHTLLHVGKVSLYYLAAYIGGALPVSCATTYCASEGASTPLLFGVSVFHATCFE